MRSYRPNRPTGTTNKALFDEAVHDRVFGARGQFVNSSTVKFSRTSRGIVARVKPSFGGAKASTPIGVAFYQVVGMFGDYWAGLGADGFIHPVAKPPELRNSLNGAFIEGHFYQYQYPTPVQSGTLAYMRRLVIAPNQAQVIEGITPPYIIKNNPAGQLGSSVVAITMSATGAVIQDTGDNTSYGSPPSVLPPGTPITLQDLSARCWSVLLNQSGLGS